MAHRFMYLTTVVDVVSCRRLAHKVAATLNSNLLIERLEQAFACDGTPEFVNTDQGSPFTAIEFTDEVLDSGVKLSMDETVQKIDEIST